MSLSVSVGTLVVGISCVFALWMIVEMAMLVWSRTRDERKFARAKQLDLEITRDLLAAVYQQNDYQFTAFNTASAQERLRAARGLIQLVRGEDREKLFHITEAAKLLDGLVSELVSPQVVRRIDAVRELEQVGSSTCIDGLQKCLASDQNAMVRLEAAAALARLGKLPNIRNVIEMLKLETTKLTKLHAALFRSVAARDGDELMILANDEALRWQRAAIVDALGWTENFEVLVALARHGNDTDPEVRCAALRAARKIGHPSAGQWITPLLFDPSIDVRVQAVQACGALGLEETIPILASLTQSPSWWLRTRAAEALETLRPNLPSTSGTLAVASK